MRQYNYSTREGLRGANTAVNTIGLLCSGGEGVFFFNLIFSKHVLLCHHFIRTYYHHKNKKQHPPGDHFFATILL